MRPDEQDTIVAIATAPGRGGIGIVRLSGGRSREIAEPMLRLRHGLAAGAARFGSLLDDAGETLDEVVVTWFAAPRSYTSEDVVEIAVHGSPVLLDYVVRQCVARGARLAEAGEFTRRAFLSGRLDLTQAEAVQDLIASSTVEQARVAARQMGGGLSRSVAPIKRELVGLIAELEAGIDFAEDDIDLLPQPRILARVAEVREPLERLAGTFTYGRVVRAGFTLAIVGRPNAGKSSLFNRLLERERAIVTALPGTTRDPVSERVSIGGIPVELVDTAGLREVPEGPEGEAERLGIERSRTAMAEADVVLLVVDGSLPSAAHREDEDQIRALAVSHGREPLVVVNKSDLRGLDAWTGTGVRCSALMGSGIAEVREAILGRLAMQVGEPALVTNVRQHGALREAVEALRRAEAATGDGVPHEMVLLDLYGALEGLDRLTGVTTSDDVLALIFAQFCIGK